MPAFLLPFVTGLGGKLMIGLTVLLVLGGLFAWGKHNDDLRAVAEANQRVAEGQVQDAKAINDRNQESISWLNAAMAQGRQQAEAAIAAAQQRVELTTTARKAVADVKIPDGAAGPRVVAVLRVLRVAHAAGAVDQNSGGTPAGTTGSAQLPTGAGRPRRDGD